MSHEEGDSKTFGKTAEGGSESAVEQSMSKEESDRKDMSISQASMNPRDIALNQASQVLESLQGGEVYLDGFNLLQVIANPRGNPHDLTFSSGRYGLPGGLGHSRHGGLAHSRHGSQNRPGTTRSNTQGRTNSAPVLLEALSQQQQQQQQSAQGEDDVLPMHSSGAADIIQETYHQIESTLIHVTEQLETMNQALEEWSRKILEEDPYSNSDDLPEAQLRELPDALQTQPASMNDLQTYLGECGVLAHKFQELRGMHRQLELYRIAAQPTAAAKDLTKSFTSAETVALLKEEIPEAFWREVDELDLTHLDTFESLFFAEKIDLLALKGEPNNNHAETSVHTWFPLVPPDSLNPWLDKVEIALLEAVREQSHSFFEESIRFASIQQLIEELLGQVISLQSSVESLLNDSVRPMQTVPADHTEKQEWFSLVDFLDSANELIRCKASIPGYLSAADDFTALDQVYFARTKLKQSNLTQLLALQGATKQLDQYEELIVGNLRDELVEAFLDWNASTQSSTLYTLNKPGNVSRVRDIFKALQKCQALPKTVQAYNTRLQDVLRLNVRTVVAEFADGATSGAAGMTLERFLDCLDMTMEQLLALLSSAAAVDAFCTQEGLRFLEEESGTPVAMVVTAAAELSSKSISELLRSRKDAHSLLTLEQMKLMWDKCVTFATTVEELTGYKASTLRSTLLAQAKSFVERKHDSNMAALAAALESERWTQCDVSTERQAALNRLCTGRALLPRSFDDDDTAAFEEKEQEVEVNGVRYKVVWSCLLLVEMVIGNLSAASHFTGSTSSIIGKVSDLLRLFNTRTTQLVLGAKAIHSAARLKSINAKHLSLVTQCLGLVISILPNIRASLMAQLPSKQHRLLNDIDQIKKEYADHNESVMNKFVTIIGGIIEHHLMPKLPGTDFDARAREIPREKDGSLPCCVFLEGIASNTTKMHHVLLSLLPPDALQDVFSRIFAYVDHKIPTLFILEAQKTPATTNAQKPAAVFRFPQNPEGKQRMLLEAETLTQKLNGLDGVQPWDFTMVNVLERTLEYNLDGSAQPLIQDGTGHDSEAETEGTTLPSDTEEPYDNGRQHEALAVSKNEVKDENGIMENGSGELLDYPAEVTTL